MLTQEQLRAEQQKEAKANRIAEAIISKTAWGKFYKYMRAAAKAGEDNIPHKVCVDKNGRVIRIYKSKAGKWAGAFLKPAHEQAARDLSQKKTGRAFLDMIGFGGFLDANDQKHATCFVIRPSTILRSKSK